MQWEIYEFIIIKMTNLLLKKIDFIKINQIVYPGIGRVSLQKCSIYCFDVVLYALSENVLLWIVFPFKETKKCEKVTDMGFIFGLNLQLRYGTKKDLSLVTVFMALDVQFTIKIW